MRKIALVLVLGLAACGDVIRVEAEGSYQVADVLVQNCFEMECDEVDCTKVYLPIELPTHCTCSNLTCDEWKGGVCLVAHDEPEDIVPCHYGDSVP